MSSIKPLDYQLSFPTAKFRDKRIIITGSAEHAPVMRAMTVAYALLKTNEVENIEMTFSPTKESVPPSDSISLLVHDAGIDVVSPVGAMSIEIMTDKQFRYYLETHFTKAELWSAVPPILNDNVFKTPGWEYFRVISVKFPHIYLVIAPPELGLVDAVTETLSMVSQPIQSERGWGRLIP